MKQQKCFYSKNELKFAYSHVHLFVDLFSNRATIQYLNLILYSNVNVCFRLTGSEQNSQAYPRKPQQNNGQLSNGLSRGNIVAVEPYNHVPLPNAHQIKNIQQTTQEVCILYVYLNSCRRQRKGIKAREIASGRFSPLSVLQTMTLKMRCELLKPN